MKLTDRIARRLGFTRTADIPLPESELVIFATYEDAREAGFASTGRHDRERHVRAWYPGMGIRGLSGPSPRRVTIPHHMTDKRVGGEGRLVDILRARQRVFDYPVWIVL